jgi:hypothetical protein
VILTSAAEANVVWPGLLLTQRLVAPWVIALSLLIESLFVWRIFRLTPGRAFLAALAANVASMALGVVGIPVLGILPDLALHITGLHEWFGWLTFSAAGWALIAILAVAFNLAVELPVYRYAFKLRLTPRAIAWLATANAITVGIAFISNAIVPVPLY